MRPARPWEPWNGCSLLNSATVSMPWRLLRSRVEDALAGELLFGRLRHGGLVRLGVKDNELVLQFPDAAPAQGAEAKEGDDGRNDA